MINSINAACDILARTTDDDKFEYIEAERSYSSYWGRGRYNGWYDPYDDYDFEEKYYMIEFTDEKGKLQWYDVVALSEEEAVGRFLIDFPDVRYRDVNAVYVDKSLYAK